MSYMSERDVPTITLVTGTNYDQRVKCNPLAGCAPFAPCAPQTFCIPQTEGPCIPSIPCGPDVVCEPASNPFCAPAVPDCAPAVSPVPGQFGQ